MKYISHGITSHICHSRHTNFTILHLLQDVILHLLQDVKNRRNPRLVPYILLDERTKKSNKDSLKEAVRTLLGYGYNLEAPDHDHGIVFAILPLNILSFLKSNQIVYHLHYIPYSSSISIRPKQDVC